MLSFLAGLVHQCAIKALEMCYIYITSYKRSRIMFQGDKPMAIIKMYHNMWMPSLSLHQGQLPGVPTAPPTSAVFVHNCNFYCRGRGRKIDLNQKWDWSFKTRLCFKNIKATRMLWNLSKKLWWKSGTQQSIAESSDGGREEGTTFLLIL